MVLALPFERTVVEIYEGVCLGTMSDGLRSREGDGGGLKLSEGCEKGKKPSEKDEMMGMGDPRGEAFWKVSRYPVRGVWGDKGVYEILRDLLEQNVRIASERLFDSGVLMSARLAQSPSSSYPSNSFPPFPQSDNLSNSPY